MDTKWYQKQIRILQTVMREKDLENYDADAVVSYMKKTNANCIVVNAGGVIDFFPNKVEFGRPNRFMGDQDFLKDLIKGCHDNDMHVIVRVDFRGVEPERYVEHPDWFGQNRDETPLMGWNNKIHRPCYNSYYGKEHAVEFLNNFLDTYDVDGVWENCVIFGFGACYCKKCREAYRAYSGEEIPERDDYFSDAFKKYREWKETIARAHMGMIKKVIKDHGDEKAYVSEIFDMYHVTASLNSGIDLYDAREYFDFLVSPLFIDGSANPSKKYEEPGNVATAIHFMKAISDGKECVALTGNNGTKWRYVKAPSKESRIWMWEAVSAGGDLWNNYFNGQHPAMTVDKRNAYLQEDAYNFLKENEKVLHKVSPYGEVGVFYSRKTRDHFGNDDFSKDNYGTAIKGLERVLLEEHLQYRFIPDILLSKETLQGIKTLIIPNAVCMSDKEMEIIREYVKNGGGLVSTFMTSLYDENGKKREDFGLSDLFGCSFTGFTEDTHFDCYQEVRIPTHPVLKYVQADKTRMIINEENTLICTKNNDEYESVTTYVPLIYNQPPEFAWIKNERTEYPVIISGTYGKGKVVYFANQTDKACLSNGHEDLTGTLSGAIKHTLQTPLSVTTDAPESVHLCVTEKNENEFIVSLVNTTGGSYRPMKEIVPVSDISVRLEMKNVKFIKNLYHETEVDAIEDENGITLRIRKLHEFSSVYVNMNK